MGILQLPRLKYRNPSVFQDFWILRTTSNPNSRLRLFCLSHAGAGASIFYHWRSGLPEDIDVCPVQYPGRENRFMEPLFIEIKPLVEAAAEALCRRLDRPFAIFGHSLGALVAFELARIFRDRYSAYPVHLFVSGHQAPQVDFDREPIHALPHEQFIKKLREFNGMPKEVLEHDELMEIMVPVLRADFAMAETYFYEKDAPLDCPITACGGLDDKYVDHEGLNLWAQQTSKTFSLRMFPGDHFYLNHDRDLLLQVISRELAHYF
jgi:medium-chain acyl-[acyl-carrier-protein] hydrolase